MGEVVTLVDLPGTYTLAGMNPAECVALNYLTVQPVDVIINVIDASHMAQGLNLTFELLEIGKPVIVALNMMDEAARMGLQIDGLKLQELLGVTVLPLVASKGRGVKQLFIQAHAAAKAGKPPRRITYSPDVEAAIQSAAANIDGQFAPLNAELVAIKLLESTSQVVDEAKRKAPELLEQISAKQQEIAAQRGQLPAWLVNAERRQKATDIVDVVVHQGKRYITVVVTAWTTCCCTPSWVTWD